MKKIIILVLFFYSSILFSAETERFLSLKKSKVNVRYGPGFDYDVKYIYKKINLPLKIIDKKENFRRVIDFKNNSGWIHISQLKKSKSFIILDEKILFIKPSIFSKPIIKIAEGRLLTYKKCENKWCKVKTEKYYGWIKADNIWGKAN